MPKIALFALLIGLAGRAGLARAEPAAAAAQAQSITITTLAEVEKRTGAGGAGSVQLRPADRVAAGDLLVYSLLVHNDGAAPVAHASFTSPIPEHMIYVAYSAVGPGADVSFSVDGGRNFDVPEKLSVAGPNGTRRAAVPADYTTIRWVLRNRLRPGSVARARFLALVK